MLDRVGWPETDRDVTTEDGHTLSITRIESGVNETFHLRRESASAGDAAGPEQSILKFATFSRPSSFRADALAMELLGRVTDLPVPTVYAVCEASDLPAALLLEFRPGESLPGQPSPENPEPVRALGAVIRSFAAVPAAAIDGYGILQRPTDLDERQIDATARRDAGGRRTDGDERGESTPIAVGEYDDARSMLVEYGTALYEEQPAHDRLASVAQRVPASVRDNREQFPHSPEPTVCVTDLSPENLLAPGGTVASPDDVTGVLDLERARAAPVEFTAVNAEYLLTRSVDDPEPLVDALYDPLPFGPDVPARDLYWLLAVGRSVHSLDLWYEEGSEHHRRRGNEVADVIERILAE